MGSEIFLVLVGSVAVAGFARWRGWSAPLVVTAVFLAISVLPFVPEMNLDGHLLLSLVLPPLLYSASLDVSFIGFRKALPQIRRLGVGLVLVTALAVGLVAWWMMPELGFAGAMLLGAIVAPPDAVSAAAIGRKLGLPRRVMTLMSGESLINDATSLTLVRVFAAIVAGATVTVWDGIVEFVLAIGVGVGIGLVLGIALHQLRLRVSDPVVTGTVGLLVPFGAYAMAEAAHGSGVLAVVAMGLYVGYNAPKTSYATRQQDGPLWSSMDFLLESFVFAYIGLQLTGVVSELARASGMRTLGIALAVFGVVLAIRPVFVYGSYWWGQLWQSLRIKRWKRALEAYHRDPDGAPAAPIRRIKKRARRQAAIFTHQAEKFERQAAAAGAGTVTAVRCEQAAQKRRERAEEYAGLSLTSAQGSSHALTDRKRKGRRLLEFPIEPKLSTAELGVVSWAGMRGVVTLAMAAALPDLTDGALSDSHAEVIIACAFVVTVGTLLVQGTTLAPLIRLLKVDSARQQEIDRRQVEAVHRKTRQAGHDFLEKQQEAWRHDFGDDKVDFFNRAAKALIRVQRGAGSIERAVEEVDQPPEDDVREKRREISKRFAEVSQGWLDVRRQVIVDQRDEGNLSDEVMRELIAALDAEELALVTRNQINRQV